MPDPSYRLVGYAIVSKDDRIADHLGVFPEALRNEADWAYFQAGLDRSDLTLLGRASHDAAPNNRKRRRLVMTGSSGGVEHDSAGLWRWNPRHMPLLEALRLVLPAGGTIAVPGGRDMFDFVGPANFEEFHLARARRCSLAGGRGLFSECERGVSAAALLDGGGLHPEPARWLDEAEAVDLTVWRRSPRRSHLQSLNAL